MKKLLGLILVLTLMLSCAAFAQEAAPALQKDLVILYTSDVHCGIDQGWGYAGLYAVKESLSKDNYVLLVDDGDAIQGEPIGTMTTGEAIIDIMNTVGYDVAIPGNHEFDYGMDRFLELTKKSSFAIISSAVESGAFERMVMGNGVTAAPTTLTRIVKVQILVPQPFASIV